jgi:hypothetical protein
MMSWAPQVIADHYGNWHGNGLRFATKEEALQNVRALSLRWTAVRDTRVIETTEPVTAKWIDGKTVHLK